MKKFGFTLALAAVLTAGTLGQVSAQTGDVTSVKGVIMGDKVTQCNDKTGVIMGDNAGVIMGDKVQRCETEKTTAEYIWDQIMGVIMGD